MSTLEAHTRGRGMKRLKALVGSWWTKVDQKVLRDSPDDIGCLGGLLVAVEWKRTANTKPRPGQIHTLDKIKEAGGIAGVLHPDNVDEFIDELRNLDYCGECGNLKKPKFTEWVK